MAPSISGGRKLRFGTCALDLDTRQLFVNGREVHITPKGFELLTLLTEHAPKALTKAYLIEHLWPKTYVSEDALARLVADLRTALGENARLPRWIRTVHGFGYSFVADTLQSATDHPLSACSLTWGSREFRLTEGDNIIGRDSDVQILINSQVVSRRHACITLADGIASVKDLSSKNGTSVGGTPVFEARVLDHGDVITIGEFEFKFQRMTNLATVTRQ